MLPRRRSRRVTVELEGRIDHMERILEEVVQVVQDTHNNTGNAPEPLIVPLARAELVGHTTIKQFQ